MLLIPRMQVFEIGDQEWFPQFLRTYVQSALTEIWNTQVPLLQSAAPSHIVGDLLLSKLAGKIASYTFIDFCAGAGGPTPRIEERVNGKLREDRGKEGVQFIMTDLFPNVWGWSRAVEEAKERAVAEGRGEKEVLLGFEERSVDASAAPRGLFSKEGKGGGGEGVFRLFNLAFHHFDDGLAKRILKDTVETSQGFAIFELQDRTFSSFVTICLVGIGILAAAPVYAVKWRAPSILLFTYLIPVLPFVLVWDGFMSMVRTRTPEEVEALLRTCGAKDAEDGKWVVQHGEVRHLWPCGYLNYIICMPIEEARK